MKVTPYRLSVNRLNKILGESEITADSCTTGFEYEDEHFYLCAYINNGENKLADISLMINGKVKEVSEKQKQIVLNKLIEVCENELTEIEQKENDTDYNGCPYEYYGVSQHDFINLNF